MTKHGYRKISTLPESKMLTSSEQKELFDHIKALDNLAAMTPAQSERSAKSTMVCISKMMLTLPSRVTGETGMESRGEAYMAALDDISDWAVVRAMRNWYRGNCKGEHDYRWQPGPFVLRNIAYDEQFSVIGMLPDLRDLLAATPAKEFSEADCVAMKVRLASINPAMATIMGAPIPVTDRSSRLTLDELRARYGRTWGIDQGAGDRLRGAAVCWPKTQT